MHSLKLLKLAQAFFFRVLRHLRLQDLFAILLDLFIEFIAFAQFCLDRLELLPQKVFTLRTINVGTSLRVDLLLNGKDIDLFIQQVVHAAESRNRIINVEDGLAVFHLQFQI